MIQKFILFSTTFYTLYNILLHALLETAPKCYKSKYLLPFQPLANFMLCTMCNTYKWRHIFFFSTLLYSGKEFCTDWRCMIKMAAFWLQPWSRNSWTGSSKMQTNTPVQRWIFSPATLIYKVLWLINSGDTFLIGSHISHHLIYPSLPLLKLYQILNFWIIFNKGQI